MLWRALFAFLVLPGMVAFAVPLALVANQAPSFSPRPLGLLVFFSGLFVLVWCTVVFLVSGRGTLAPWDPPQRLVAVGPYRFSRNPMYVGVTLILIGWAALFWSAPLLIYAALVLLAFHIRVIAGEEPWLARRFGADWESYRARVPRWLFRWP
ncbi:MAG TPA: methyltransferase [Steroidobacteraceae bacterium]|jgi:protein-S-isoprenylcysteine O-methyltransferase Ste14|nr:methyltransferase [Steroidobacteraceae bacterium]